MAWYAVWRTADGELVSTGTVLADPLPAGLASFDFVTPQTGVWNKVTHVFDAAAVLKPVLSVKQFWKRFTEGERENLWEMQTNGTAVQKRKLGAFKDYILGDNFVDLNEAYIQSSVQLMETAGVIGAGRAAVILA